MGGIGGAFARHADNVVSAVHSEGQPLLRAIMMRLVTPDGTRAVVDHKDLLSLSADPKDVERILDQLVRARLIQLHTEPDQPASVEIVHEMLISEWPTLRRWLDDTHAARALTHELRQASKQWIARGKPNDLVWRGATAQEALRHARRHTLELSANEQQFLTAIEMLAARTRRRRLLALTSIAVALALVLAGGTFALVKIKMAETAAQEEARQAVRARQSETAAKEEAQLKVEAYETERKAREMAEREKRDEEQKRKDEEQKRRDVEEDLADTKKQSLEQVQQQLKETEAARQREAKANEELRAQKKETERLYAKEKAAREKAEAEARSKGIATKPLIPGAK